MFVIKRNGRPVSYFKGYKFPTYEIARQALRSYIRMNVQKNKFDAAMFDGKKSWDHVSRNPVNYTDAGFRITSVKA